MAINSRETRFLHRRNGRTDRRTDGRTDKPSYRDARTHLKTGCRYSFLVADTRFYTLLCRYVGRLRIFLNSERFPHYCSCPTVRDWIAVYSALFFHSSSFPRFVDVKTRDKSSETIFQRNLFFLSLIPSQCKVLLTHE